jgi:putative transposase
VVVRWGQEGKGRKRHILLDTEGFVLKGEGPQRLEGVGPSGNQGATAQSGRAIPPPVAPVAGRRLARRGEGRRDWVRKTLGWSVELVERPKKLVAEEVLMRCAAEWQREGVAVDWRKVLPPKGYVVLPRRWVVQRTISWIDQQRRMSLGTTRGCVRAGRRWCTLP